MGAHLSSNTTKQMAVLNTETVTVTRRTSAGATQNISTIYSGSADIQYKAGWLNYDPSGAVVQFDATGYIDPMGVAFNPKDCDSHTSLSNGDLTSVINTGGDWSACRATSLKSSGKWYWEVTLNQVGGNTRIGVANGSFSVSLNNPIGFDVNSWSFDSDGLKSHSNVNSAYGPPYGAGDIIGVALDMGGGSITFYKNGVSLGQAFTGLAGSLYAAITAFYLGDGMTANFGDSAFAYGLPSGFSAYSVAEAPTNLPAIQNGDFLQIGSGDIFTVMTVEPWNFNPIHLELRLKRGGIPYNATGRR